jgi:hypothetical protein
VVSEREVAEPYFVYLVVGFSADPAIDYGRADPYDWVDLGSLLRFQVGRVTFGAPDSNLVPLHANVTVPPIGPGWYSLLACDLGCQRPLANVFPSRVRVWVEPESAKVANRLDESRALLGQLRVDLRNERARANQAETRVGIARNKVASLEAQVEGLEAHVATLESQLSEMATVLSAPAAVPEEGSDGTPWWTVTAWFLAGAAVGFGVAALVVRRRRRTAEPPVEAWREADRAMRDGTG